MNPHRILIALVAAFVILTIPVSVAPAQESAPVAPTAHPFLWRIEGSPPSHLYGTIHLPDERVRALPQPVRAAIDSCDGLFTEIPMDLSSQLKAMAHVMLPGMTTLRDKLPAGLYHRLDEYLQSKGFNLLVFSKFKIWTIAVQLELLDQIERLATSPALDQMIYDVARAAGKQVGGLETVREQIDVFDTLTDAEQILLLRKTLDQIEELARDGKSEAEMLLEAYLCGDLDLIEATTEASLDEEDAFDRKLRNRLIVQRNIRMADRIEQRIRDNPGKSYFFAAGVAHFLDNEHGIANLLRRKGFVISRIAPPRRILKRRAI